MSRDQTHESFGARVRDKLRAILLDDLQLKLLSILIVVVIWFSVAGQVRQATPISITGIDIVLENLPPQFAVTSSSQSQAKIRVQGSEEVLRELRIAASTRSGDLVAYADLAPFREGGVQIAPLLVRGLPEGVTLQEVDPPAVRITLDPIVTRQVKVEPRLTGTVPPGYKFTGAWVSPDLVTVRAPQSVLDEIDELNTTTVSLNNRTESFEKPVEVDITSPDTTVAESVVIHVEIQEDSGAKEFTVPVTSPLGQVEPTSLVVRLKGPFPALNQIKSSDITAAVNPLGDGPRQTLTPQIQLGGPFATRVEVESVRPQQVRWRKQ